jgi:hypothetical protein
MRTAHRVLVLATVLLPAVAIAHPSAPVSESFRRTLSRLEKNLVASAEAMPADKYGFKPTAAQMTFGEVVLHVAGDNDEACAPIGGVQAPKRASLAPTDDRAKLIARLRESFALCDQVASHLDDAGLAKSVSAFGEQFTRAGLMSERVEDWSDHYSQMAIYLRLNGVLPPTARGS